MTDNNSAAGGYVSLRDALGKGSKAAPAPVEEPALEAPTAELPVVAPLGAPSEGADTPPAEAEAEAVAPSPGRALTLREAIARRAAAPDPAPPAPDSAPPAAPPIPTAAPPAPPPAPPAGQPAPAAPAPAGAVPAGRGLSLRDAIAAQKGAPAGAAPPAAAAPGGSAPPVWNPPTTAPPTASGPQVVSMRGPGRAAPAPAWEAAEAARPRDGRGSRVSRLRPRVSVPVPEVKTAPSKPILIAVGIAMGVLVIVALVAVVLTGRSPQHHVPSSGTASASVDACHLITADEATAAFGGTAGIAHFVLGTCVYDNGSHELIVAVARQNAKAEFDLNRSSTAQNVPGLGDSAYYADGRLRVLKGTNLVLLTLTPYSATAPSPKLLTLAKSAVGRA